MNNIQKSFKRKSELRAMADGGAAPVKRLEGKSGLRSFPGLANGGQVFKSTVGGVSTYTDAGTPAGGAKAYTPGQGGGTFSTVGMEPAQRQQMDDAVAQRRAAANAPTTLGGRLDAALSRLSSPPTTTGAPSSTPTLGSELDAAIGRTQGVTSTQTPATGVPANDVNRTVNPQGTSGIFSRNEIANFNRMGQASAAGAAQMRDIGLQAGAAAARPTSPLQSSNFDEPSFELEFADGGDVKGKGGPTDDKVGPVMLSDGEYVLPADTVDIVGRDNLDALRLATHGFVDEDNKPKVSRLRKMANGGVFYVTPDGKTARGPALPQPGTSMVPYQPQASQLPATQTAPPRAAPAAEPLRAQPVPPKPGTPPSRGGNWGGRATGAAAALPAAGQALDAAQRGDYATAGARAAESAITGASLGAKASSMSMAANTPTTALRPVNLSGTGALRGAMRRLPVVAGIMGAADSFQDAASGYDKEYARNMGVDTSNMSAGAAAAADLGMNTLRTLENIGNVGGLTGRLGRGIGAALSPQDGQTRLQAFLEGASSADPREAYYEGRSAAGQTPAASTAAPGVGPQSATPAANVLGQSAMADESNQRTPYRSPYAGQDPDLRGAGGYQGALENRSGLANSDPRINGSTSAAYNALSDDAVIGSYKGQPMTKREADARAAGLQTASFMPPQTQQSDPVMDEIRSALRNTGGGGGGGGWAPSSNAGAINERYDKLANQLSGMYSRKGQGNLARHLVNLEAQRADALDADARNLTSARGQNMSAQTANLNARISALSTMGNLEAQRRRDAAAATAAGGKAAADAAKAAEARDEQGLTDIREAVRARFGEDSALAESTLSRILSAGQDQIGRVTSLTGQDRAAAIEDLLDSALAAQSFDDQQSSLWGNTDSGLPRATETRDPRFFRDVFAGGNRALPALGREVKDFFGFDGRVMVDDNGRVAPLPDDLRQRRTQRRAEEDAPRRSRLRNDN